MYYNKITSRQYGNAKQNRIPFTTGELNQIESRVEYYKTFDEIKILFGSEHILSIYKFREFIYPKETNVIKIYSEKSEKRYIYIYKNEDDWFYTASNAQIGRAHV